MLDRLFFFHPRSVGESYAQHAKTAAKFGTAMISGGLACLVHALVPAFFERTASSRVKQLYADMKGRQPAFADNPPAFMTPEWQPEYEI